MGRPWYNTSLMCLQHFILLSATAGAVVSVLLALDANRNASLLPSNSLLIINSLVGLILLGDSGGIGASHLLVLLNPNPPSVLVAARRSLALLRFQSPPSTPTTMPFSILASYCLLG